MLDVTIARVITIVLGTISVLLSHPNKDEEKGEGDNQCLFCKFSFIERVAPMIKKSAALSSRFWMESS
jgi:hypothetical protein